MQGSRGAVLRAGGRQLTRVLVGDSGGRSRLEGNHGGAGRAVRGRDKSSKTLSDPVPTFTLGPAMPNAKMYPTLEKLGFMGRDHICIKDPGRVEQLLEAIVAGGYTKLQLVVDFDFTLTRVHVDGQRCHCSWGVMDNSPIMPVFYREEANRLLAKYYPIEIHPKMPEAEKIPHMLEWYRSIHDLIVKCQIQQSSLKGMVSASNVRLRVGSEELCGELHRAGVPVLVLSAGMGDILEEVLRHFKVYTDNVKVVANFFKYNKEGLMEGFQGEPIHMFNKNENAIHSSDYFRHLQGRSNVLLMGDSLGDVKMAVGIPQPSTVLKIGFLNDKIEEWLESYKNGFDIVLIDDQTMDTARAIVGLMK